MKRIPFLILVCFLIVAPLASASPTTAPKFYILGDSLSVGLYASSSTSGWAYLLADRLGYDLIMTSGNHRNICWAREQWAAGRSAGIVPDVIVLEIGLNDLNPNRQCLPEADYAAAYGALLDDLLATGAKVYVVNLFATGAQIDEAGALRYNKIIAGEASKRGIAVADIWTATVGCGRCVSQAGDFAAFAPYHGDGFHPGDYGHQVIAGVVYDTMMPGRVVMFPIFRSPIRR